jgi:hypothetical protein
MKTRRIAAVVLLTLLPQTVSLPAAAQGEDPVTLQARARFKEGVEAFDKGRYEEARLAFLQAYALKKHPAVLLNLAQSSARSNHPLEAAKYFQQFLKEAPNASPQQRKDAEAGLAEVRKQLGRIEVVAPPGTEITLDDQKVGTTPFEALDVEPGVHTLKSPTQTVTVTAVMGQKVEARFGNTAPSTAPAPVPAPSAEAATASPSEAAPAQDQPPGADRGPKKRAGLLSPPENMTPVYAGLAVAGVGLVSAVVFAAFKADAQSKADTIHADISRNATAGRFVDRDGNVVNVAFGACNRGVREFERACNTLRENNEKVDTNAMIANISLGVMGAGLLVAGAWYLFAPKRDDAKHASAPRGPILTPYAGWNAGGLKISGEF